MPDQRQVLVDADACPRPAMALLRQFEGKYGYTLVTVASFNHEISGRNHVTVGNGQDEADLALANRIHPGDVVVTQDWGLAALALAKKAQVLSPKGMVYTESNIGFLLEERHTKAKVRRQGRRTRGPKPRSTEDDERFSQALRELLKESGAEGLWPG